MRDIEEKSDSSNIKLQREFYSVQRTAVHKVSPAQTSIASPDTVSPNFSLQGFYSMRETTTHRMFDLRDNHH
jgi:hypothetical protein